MNLPSDSILNTLSIIDSENLSLVYDGLNHQLSPTQLSLLSSEALRDELSAFTITLMKYRNMENNVLDLALALRKIHQNYVSILYEERSKNSAG